MTTTTPETEGIAVSRFCLGSLSPADFPPDSAPRCARCGAYLAFTLDGRPGYLPVAPEHERPERDVEITYLPTLPDGGRPDWLKRVSNGVERGEKWIAFAESERFVAAYVPGHHYYGGQGQPWSYAGQRVNIFKRADALAQGYGTKHHDIKGIRSMKQLRDVTIETLRGLETGELGL